MTNSPLPIDHHDQRDMPTGTETTAAIAGMQEVASLKTMAAHTPMPTTNAKEEKCILNSEKRLANLFSGWLRSSVRLT